MALAIKVENLSKAYQLGQIGTGTVSRDIERWLAKVRGKEDPFLRIGETNDRTSNGSSDIVWSLKGINFEIQQGDAVGIIGRNGAGKSTFLKLLSRVTAPTTGGIKVKGRIASLLEVGTGFHPELSGRENIYLNGAILGMRKKEITRKFDEVVDFAGVEKYIDTPVKRYSSGMYVRLAFAVAAYLESEILIVDEVLAVGDAEFQKKCLGKMGEVSKGEGRTVLFVSHNMASIQRLCNTSIILNQGQLIGQGDTYDTITQYLNIQRKQISPISSSTDNYTFSNLNVSPDHLYSLNDFVLRFNIRSKEDKRLESVVAIIYNEHNQRVAIIDLRNKLGTNVYLEAGKELCLTIKIDNCPLIEGEYSLGMYIQDEITQKDYTDLYKFDILPIKSNKNELVFEYDRSVRGVVNLNFNLIVK